MTRIFKKFKFNNKSLPQVKEQYGLYLLTLLLIAVSLTTIKPTLILAGWDNFSTSLDPLMNLQRTLFATWREYRGMGVPSDSEVVDIFRQLLFLVLSPVLGQKLLEQFFVFLCLFVGVYAIYFLSKRLLKEYPIWQKELGATVTALFYLFNLNTLATFYHPMTMFVTRFAQFPLLLLVYFSILDDEKIRIKKVYFLAAVVLIGSSAYLTSTVFITLLMLLIGLLAFYKNRRRQVVLFSIVLYMNMFWLLPFYNYTTQKSSILPLASTFLEVNEIQLNKGPKTFSWRSILTLEPDFISSRPISLSDNSTTELHPYISSFKSELSYQITLAIFPTLFIIGTLAAFIKKERRFTWAAILLIFFLLLSRKFMSPTGFLYSLVTAKLPIFDVVFRFPDTKFYPVVALLGALLAGYALVFVGSFINKRTILYVLLAPVLILHLLIYKGYFISYFINPLVFSQIPDAYFDLSDDINNDSSYERVLHLPMEKISYWKPYAWGYEGSSFLTFLLDKPLIERTFEPASIENDQINQAIFQITSNASLLDEPSLIKRAAMLSDLLAKTNTGTLIWDSSINPKIYSRGKEYWGTFFTEDMSSVIETAVSHNYFKLYKTYQVNILDFLNKYTDYTGLPKQTLTSLQEKPNFDIELYKSSFPTHPFRSLRGATNVSLNHKNILVAPFLGNFTDYTQLPDKASELYPFYAPNLQLTFADQDKYELSIPHFMDYGNGATQVTAPEELNQETVINIYTKTVDNSIVLGFSEYKPFSDENSVISQISIPIETVGENAPEPSSGFVSDWWVLNSTEYSGARLAIDDVIVPLPKQPTKEFKYLGSVFTKTNQPKISVLKKTQSTIVEPKDYAFTTNPNCYEDISNNVEYEAEMVRENNTLHLTATQGTACITALLGEYSAKDAKSLELELSFNVTSTEKQDENPSFHQFTNQFQKSVKNTVGELETYRYFDICLLNGGMGSCLNNHRTIKAHSQAEIIVPQVSNAGINEPQVVLSLIPVGKQSVTLSLHRMAVHSFTPIYEETLSLLPSDDQNEKVQLVSKNQGAIINLPKPLSVDSYYYNGQNDAFLVYNKPCQNEGGYRTSKVLDTSTLVYAENCDQGLSINKTFDKDGFYIWSAQYKLLSGKNPKFTLSADGTKFKDEYLSLHTGYPNITGSKKLQYYTPFELGVHERDFSDKVTTILNTTPHATAYTYIYPNELASNYEQKLVSITQNSENQGILSVGGMHISRFPSYWPKLLITNGETNEKFSEFNIVNYKKILPSLWKVEIQGNPDNQYDYLLEFSQGYDTQWNLYQGSWAKALIGAQKSPAPHIKINGLDNGWVVPRSDLQDGGVHTYYVYYYPESLYFMGWAITVLTIILIALAGSRKKSKIRKLIYTD